jgi:mannose-6-phosphate isomerase-like protein (cupin superfamily)
MDDKVNLAGKARQLDRPFLPGLIGRYNENKIVVTRAHGELVWHKHDDTDDLFVVLEGRLTLQLRDRDIVLEPGDLYVVPRGVEHCPRADEETLVMLIEPDGTPNTGDAGGDLTAEPVEI